MQMANGLLLTTKKINILKPERKIFFGFYIEKILRSILIRHLLNLGKFTIGRQSEVYI